MIFEKIQVPIQTVGSNGAKAQLHAYIPDISVDAREPLTFPACVICPGGGYEYVSPREGEPVALRLAAAGIASFVLYYSTKPAVFPQSLCEAAWAVSEVRANAAQWHIDPKKVMIVGFSAGGHLAASLGTMYDSPEVYAALGKRAALCRPDGLVLGYPVITWGECAHCASFKALLGADFCEKKAEELSLDRLICKKTPPAFIWHTAEDRCVPVENSLRLASAYAAQGVGFELHVFPRGTHGLSLASREVAHDESQIVKEAQCWIDMAIRFIKNGEKGLQ